MRNKAIDISKGIAIILMVIGHALPDPHPVRTWIYSFHMPLFFMLSGMTFQIQSWHGVILKSAKRLLVPFVLCLLSCIVLTLLFGNKHSVWGYLGGFIYPDLNGQFLQQFRISAGAIWFLMALFWARLCMNFLLRCFPKSYLAIALILTITCGYIGKYFYYIPFAICIAGCGVGYMAMGKFMANTKIKNFLHWCIAMVLFSPIWIYSCHHWKFEMYGFFYLKRAYVITIAVAIVASLLLYYLAQLYDRHIQETHESKLYNLLQWCGQNSMDILLALTIAYALMGCFRYQSSEIWIFPYDKILIIVFTIILTIVISYGISKQILSKFHAIVLGRDRKFNQRHCYDYPSENNGWEKYLTTPIIGNSTTGTVFDPFVMKIDERMMMVYSNRAQNSIVTAVSTDGMHWDYYQTILNSIPNTWENIVNRGCVVIHNGLWMLWYTGQNAGQSAIGLATSKDGKQYIRHSSQPVLSATFPHEGVSVMNPHVIWNEKRRKFQMWYSAGEDYEPDVICYAESVDGVEWQKLHTPVLKKNLWHRWEKYKVGGCYVEIADDDTYMMYYIGYQNMDVARICFATSEDGVHWHRPKNNLLLSPSKGSWDSEACYKPTVVRNGNRLYLWYNGRKGNEEYIGLAIKEIVS